MWFLSWLNREVEEEEEEDITPTPKESLVQIGSVEEEYNPFLHRKVEKPTNNFDTFVHCVKGSFGSGVLAMPHAFMHAGTVTGVIGTVILGYILTYSIVVLIRTMNIICKLKKTPYRPYPYAMRDALRLGPRGFQLLGPVSPIIVDVFLIIYQLGTCCSYVAFMAKSLKEIMEPEVFEHEMNYRWYMLIILVPVMGVNCIRYLKHLMPVSLVADIMTFVSMVLIFYFIVGTGPLRLGETTLFGIVLNYPLFFGTVMFALEAVGVVIALEKNMKTPKDFPKVFYSALTLVVIVYAVMGFFGYAKYGEDVEGSITHSIPKENALSIAVKAIVTFCIFCSHPLQCYVSLEIIWQNYIKTRIVEKWQLLVEYIMRFTVVSVTFLVVLGVSRFEIIVSFVGAFCLSALGLIFPYTMELCVLWPARNYGRYSYILIKDIAGIILGFLLLILGTYVVILEDIRGRKK